MNEWTISRLRRRGGALVAVFAVIAAVWATLGTSTAAGKQKLALSPQVALDWNSYAVAAVRSATTMNGVPAGSPPRTLYQVEGLIYMGYVQAAVYDAVVKIEHRYRPYVGFISPAGNASPEAAVIAAAYRTLTYYLGDPSGTLATEYANSLAALPNNAATQRGLAVGQAAAAEVEAVRFADGRNAPTAVYGAPGPVVPGAWQVVPPFTTAQTPWVAFMQPFMLTHSAQFRVPAAPSLGSAQYATDFNETKAYGSATSTIRTPDQTATADFWNANAINQENQLYRDVATQHGMDLVDTARLLAMGDMTVSDAGIACFDSKYHYLRWRPYTAIRNADVDGNAATTADPAWTPLLATPNHPEYPAAHGCVTSAVTDVIAKALGTNQIDITLWGATNGGSTLTTTRHFDTVAQVQSQVIDARVWAGLHWRSSVVAGEKLGNDVANWILFRFFQPLPRGG